MLEMSHQVESELFEIESKYIAITRWDTGALDSFASGIWEDQHVNV